jgi:hypothetical protein
MDGLREIIPVTATIAIGRSRWQLDQLRLGDYAEMEHHVVACRRAEVEVTLGAIRAKSVSERRRALEETFDRSQRSNRVTCAQLQTWLQTADGVLFELWLRVRGHRKRITWQTIKKNFANRAKSISRLMAQAAESTGEYTLGKLF